MADEMKGYEGAGEHPGHGDAADPAPGTRARPNAYVARIGDRLLARIFDGLLFAVPSVVVLLAAGHPTLVKDANGDLTGIDVRHWGLLIGLFLVASAVYEIAFTALSGQTPGKRLRHIRVVHLSDGSVPGWRTSFARWFTMNAASLLSLAVSTPLSGIYGIVDLGLGLRRPLQQCLHDLTAKTVVVSDR